MKLKRRFEEQTEALKAGVQPTVDPVKSERRVPATAPGQMLAYQEQMRASNEELDTLRERVRSFDDALHVIKIDPALIRASKLANRHEASFSGTAFNALKVDIAAVGGNVQPVKVRPLSGEEGGRYELVFGHRRHRACLELKLPVLAMVESVDDVALFCAMDRENREREDLSPYEQGLHYKRALEMKVFPSLRQMAQTLEIAHSNISRALVLADLPDLVVASFQSPLEIQYRWGKILTEALAKDRKGVLARAKELSERKAKPSSLTILDILRGVEPLTSAQTVQVIGKEKQVRVARKGRAVTLSFPDDYLTEEKFADLSKLIEQFIQD